MDLPDAAKHRDRGLHEGEQSTPPVRLQMASGLCRDPITDRSSSAHSSVGSASTVAEPPARPGMSIHPQEANDRSSRLISTMAPNVGLENVSRREVTDLMFCARDSTHDSTMLTQPSTNVELMMSTIANEGGFSSSRVDRGYLSANTESLMSPSDAKHGVELDPQSVTTHERLFEHDDTLSRQLSIDDEHGVGPCGKSPRGFSRRSTETDEESIGHTHQYEQTMYDEPWSNAPRHVSVSSDVNANVHHDLKARGPSINVAMQHSNAAEMHNIRTHQSNIVDDDDTSQTYTVDDQLNATARYAPHTRCSLTDVMSRSTAANDYVQHMSTQQAALDDEMRRHAHSYAVTQQRSIDTQHGPSVDEQLQRTHHAATLDDRMRTRTSFDARSRECLDDRSNVSSPAVGAGHVDRADTHTQSLPDYSEVQFNPAAIDRAKIAGWDSQRNTVKKTLLMTPADILRLAGHSAAQRRLASMPPVETPSQWPATTDAYVERETDESHIPVPCTRTS